MKVYHVAFKDRGEALAFLRGVGYLADENDYGPCPHADGVYRAGDEWLAVIHDYRPLGPDDVCPLCVATYPWRKLTHQECEALLGADSIRPWYDTMGMCQAQVKHLVESGRIDFADLP